MKLLLVSGRVPGLPPVSVDLGSSQSSSSDLQLLLEPTPGGPGTITPSSSYCLYPGVVASVGSAVCIHYWSRSHRPRWFGDLCDLGVWLGGPWQVGKQAPCPTLPWHMIGGKTAACALEHREVSGPREGGLAGVCGTQSHVDVGVKALPSPPPPPPSLFCPPSVPRNNCPSFSKFMSG